MVPQARKQGIFPLKDSKYNKASQKPPQDIKAKERPQSSKHVNLEGAFFVPQPKKEGRKEYKFMSPPPQLVLLLFYVDLNCVGKISY